MSNRWEINKESEKDLLMINSKQAKESEEESMEMQNKKLKKSRDNRQLCGVCGGFAEYLNLDVTVVRLLWALVTIFGGAGLLAYIVAAIVMPEE